MKNTHYGIDVLFNLIKEYYVAQFPHEMDVTAIDVVNHYLIAHGSSAKIVGSSAQLSEFENPNPTKSKESDFLRNPVIELEKYLESYLDRNEFISDVIALRKWLINENYLREMKVGLVATRDLLVTPALTK